MCIYCHLTLFTFSKFFEHYKTGYTSLNQMIPALSLWSAKSNIQDITGFIPTNCLSYWLLATYSGFFSYLIFKLLFPLKIMYLWQFIKDTILLAFSGVCLFSSGRVLSITLPLVAFVNTFWGRIPRSSSHSVFASPMELVWAWFSWSWKEECSPYLCCHIYSEAIVFLMSLLDTQHVQEVAIRFIHFNWSGPVSQIAVWTPVQVSCSAP